MEFRRRKAQADSEATIVVSRDETVAPRFEAAVLQLKPNCAPPSRVTTVLRPPRRHVRQRMVPHVRHGRRLSHGASTTSASRSTSKPICIGFSQEALNNVHKHAAATRVGVILERRGARVVLIIEDDGRGFEYDEAGAGRFDSRIGLRGIRERAVLAGGTAEVETAPGKGTTIFVQVPTDTIERRPSAD